VLAFYRALTFIRWYGVGGTIQVAMFGMVASKVKQNANGAHTFLEVRTTLLEIFSDVD